MIHKMCTIFTNMLAIYFNALKKELNDNVIFFKDSTRLNYKIISASKEYFQARL